LKNIGLCLFVVTIIAEAAVSIRGFLKVWSRDVYIPIAVLTNVLLNTNMEKTYELIINIPLAGKEGDGIITLCSQCKGPIYVDSQKGIIIDGKPYCSRCAFKIIKKFLR